ncbi:MAG: FlgD immunoglobulin-like domain containing protein, partial [Bacteroidota bacterium]
LAKTAGTVPPPTVTLVGPAGGTFLGVGTLAFFNGLLITGNNTIVLPTVAQGFFRPIGGVVPPNYSHVVGNVRKAPGAFFVGRLEYPVGSAGSGSINPAYRPVAITFLLGNPLITAIGLTFNHINSPPLGSVGFPMDAGSFVRLTGTAPFYWMGTSTVGLGPSQTFDLELQAEGYTTYQLGSFGINQLRIVRRFDGSELTNAWVLQGGANYTNYITNEPVTGTPIVRVIGSSGGIEVARSRFSLGRGFITDVETIPIGIPTEYALSQNYPNPFNPTTLINFDLPKQSPVRLEIYDMLGQKVKTLINGEVMDPGYYKVTWNGTNQSGTTVASGVYYYRIVADKFASLKKMLLLK